MSQLSNYSVETDQLILLSFEDGRSLRVPISQLPKYLKGRDLQRVRRAINMRRAFFRQNMPPTIIVLIATLVVAALAAAGEHTLAAIFSGASSPGSQLPGAVHMVQSAPATSLVITVSAQNSCSRRICDICAATSSNASSCRNYQKSSSRKCHSLCNTC
jgi:hypothetical protein